MLEKYPQQVKLVIKHFPLSSHKYARQAAAAALAANNQGKFWEFHHELFRNYRALNEAKIQQIAGELQLDMDTFNRDMKSPAIQTLIDRDMKNGYEAGVRGTPTVFIDGKLLRRRDLQGFQQAIEEELERRGTAGAQGSKK